MDTLARRAAEDELYRPAGKRYHIEQLRAIEAVELQNISPSDGLRLWQARRALLRGGTPEAV